MTNARLSQAVAEVVVKPTSEDARLSQVVTEVVIKPTSPHGRLSQAVSEVVIGAAHATSDLAIDAIVRAAVGASLHIDYNLNLTNEPVYPVYDADVYGDPTYTPTLINPEVYGEVIFLTTGSANLAIDYIVDSIGGKSLSVDASLANAVGSSLAIDYVTDKVVHADRSLDYVIKDLATKDLALDYAIDNVVVSQVDADLGIDYAVGSPGGVGANLAFHYRVTKATKRLQVGANLAFKYAILKKVSVGKNLGFKYRIIPATHVGSNLGFHYTIQKNTVAGANLLIGYQISINNLAGKSLGVTYGIAPSPSAVGADLSFDDAISINNVAGASLSFDDAISINNLVGIDLGLDYAEAEAGGVGQDLDLDWDLASKSEIGVDLDFDAAIDLSTPRSDLAFDADIAQETPFADLAIDAALGSVARSDLGLDYGLAAGAGTAGTTDKGDGPGRRYVIVDRRTKPPVPTQVGSELGFSYTILGAVEAELFIDASIRRIDVAQLSVDAPIRIRRGIQETFDHRIVDFYDTNAALLLEEIDHDLVA